MKLARKLMLALVVAILAVFSARALMRVQYEIQRSEEAIRDDERLLGRAMRPALVQVWRAQGQSAALEMLRSANTSFRQTEIRWVEPEALPKLTGDEATLVQKDSDPPSLTTYFVLSPDGSPPGALEISRSLVATRRALREKVLDVVATAAVATLVAMAVVSLVGLIVVGRPMRRLAEQARRIGAGDLSHPLVLSQKDEIGQLANEMNQMCERLRDAQGRLAAETSARMKTLEQLRHADRLSTVGKLASGIAHELGTPLNVVCGRAKMIATGEVVSAESQESAGAILEQGQRMAKIISDLLGFARRRGPQKAVCHLETLARDSLALLAPLAQKSGVHLEVRGHGPSVPVDGAQVQQALTNLVVNGIHAMPAGGTITVAAGQALVTPPPERNDPPAEYAFLAVRDQGIGIPPEQRARVFEPFFTTKGVGEGTGLGLSVAYGIAQDHGGWIDVDSEVGKGSCFTLYLPLQAPATGGSP
jgi:signal transduction histidine kinase